MPLKPGAYEIRYVQAGKKVLAAKPITITEVTVNLTAPETAKVGAPVSVGFEGANNKNDWITVVPPDLAENRYTDYKYSREGNPVELTMPVEPGEYELRYVLDGKRVIGRKPITLEDVEVTLDGPASVTAETEFDVAFTSPGYYRDWVTIVAPDAAQNRYTSYRYAREGSPVTLRAPKEPGTYELRYVLSGKRVVATRPITVTAP